MTTYTQDKKFINEVIGDSLLEDAIDWISHNLSPEEVFEEAELENWARQNGFVEEGE